MVSAMKNKNCDLFLRIFFNDQHSTWHMVIITQYLCLIHGAIIPYDDLAGLTYFLLPSDRSYQNGLHLSVSTSNVIFS